MDGDPIKRSHIERGQKKSAGLLGRIFEESLTSKAANTASLARRCNAASNVVSLSFAAATHHVEELCVVLGRLHLVEDEFHRFDFVHVVHQLAQDPDLLQLV